MKFRKYFWIVLLVFSVILVLDNNKVFLFAEKYELCAQKGVVDSLEIVSKLIRYIKVIIPVAIIIKSGISLAKAVIADDDKNINSSVNSFIKRIIVGAVIFLVPTFIDVILNMVPKNDEIPSCVRCIVNSKYCD